VTDPYAWYWTASTAHEASSPSLGVLAIVVLMPIVALVVLSVGLVVWDRWDASAAEPPSTLTDAERRALAAIARGLRHDDPELARRLTSVDVCSTGGIR
jgi:hypothetical protein